MISDTLCLLKKSVLVPVLRAHTEALAQAALRCLLETGYPTVEITMTTPCGEALVREWSDSGMCVGAGTILNRDMALRCLDAGARYIVSPTLVAGLPELCHAAGVPCILGAFTPTEVAAARDMGADAVKVFPAKAGGGPGYIMALRDVFPNIPLVPTGGVNIDNIAAYLRAGAAFVGIGGNLFHVEALARGELDAGKERLLAFKKAAESAQPEASAL